MLPGLPGPNQAFPSVEFTSTPHTGEFNAADAEAINNNFNLVAYGIAHGPGGEDKYGHLPEIEIEYSGARALVDSLDPARGDVLFVEDVGYDPTVKDHVNWAEHMDYLEVARSARSINAITYALLLAKARSIPVVSADLTRQEVEIFNNEVGEDARVHGLYPDWPHSRSFHTSREQAAAHTVKGRALEALPTLNGDKPTYALVYGKAHFEKQPGESKLLEAFWGRTPGIKAAFNQLGLQIETVMLPDAWDARVQAMASLVGQLPNFPDAPHGDFIEQRKSSP